MIEWHYSTNKRQYISEVGLVQLKDSMVPESEVGLVESNIFIAFESEVGLGELEILIVLEDCAIILTLPSHFTPYKSTKIG